MDAEKWVGGGVLTALVSALGFLHVRRRKSDDDFAHTENRVASQRVTRNEDELIKARIEIRAMQQLLAEADRRANKLEIDLHDLMHKNDALKRDLKRLIKVIRNATPKAEVLDFIEHSNFSPLDG